MTDRCTQYALDVVAGVIVAGEYVKLACQRHLDDLEKAKADILAMVKEQAPDVFIAGPAFNAGLPVYCYAYACLKYFSHVDLKICTLPCSHRLNFCSGTPSCAAYAFCVKPSR